MNATSLEKAFTETRPSKSGPSGSKLRDGSRVAVLGGGPAGSLFSYFLLEMAERAGMDLQVDIFERKNFTTFGPAGCNMCGGIISESLVQTLATEGINLPPTVVERGIDSYVLHMDVGSVRIETPLHEKRIASLHRGAGPRGTKERKWDSFDKFLLDKAISKGTRVIPGRGDEISIVDGYPHVGLKGEEQQQYDLLAVAIGVNTGTLKIIEKLPIDYVPPKTSGTYICEFYLGAETIEKYLGSSMHVFLLNLPRLEFAALIPKGDFASFCLLGHNVDDALVQAFLDSPEVKKVLPPEWARPTAHCHCSPRINVGAAAKPYADRIVFIGDSGASRLYKDGIGAAYRTAKAAATTAVFHGVSAEDFQKHFHPACKKIEMDNTLGRLIFFVTREIQRRQMERRGVLRMVSKEQGGTISHTRMSTVLWDTFTGSAPYRDILVRTFHPAFLGRFAWEIAAGLVRGLDGGVPFRKAPAPPHDH
jgi:flavin-dependent dehydrogenase